MVRVSVIIPAYNAEAFLGKCVDSVLGQTFDDIEVILVDDGSTDSTPGIIDDYAVRDSRVVAVHTPNQGPADARHTGVARATGEYLCFCDSDDYRPLDAIGALYEKATETGADLVSGDYWVSRYPGAEDFVLSTHPYMVGTDGMHGVKAWLDGALQGGLWSFLIRRSLYTDTVNDYLKVMYGEDGVVLLQLIARAGTIAQLHAPVYYYVLRKGSLSNYAELWSEKWVETYAQVTRWTMEYIDRLPDKSVFADEYSYYCLYRMSILLLKTGGRDLAFPELEQKIYNEHYCNRHARKRLREKWFKQWIFLCAKRNVLLRCVKGVLWGNGPMRGMLSAIRRTMLKVRS